MIKQKILKLKQAANIDRTDFSFPAGTEFEIVADIVYMGGYPVPQNMQGVIYKWLVANMANTQLFKDDLRRFN